MTTQGVQQTTKIFQKYALYEKKEIDSFKVLVQNVAKTAANFFLILANFFASGFGYRRVSLPISPKEPAEKKRVCFAEDDQLENVIEYEKESDEPFGIRTKAYSETRRLKMQNGSRKRYSDERDAMCSEDLRAAAAGFKTKSVALVAAQENAEKIGRISDAAMDSCFDMRLLYSYAAPF